MASTIWRIEVSSPPGVFMRTMTRGAVAVGVADRGHDVGGADGVHHSVELDDRDRPGTGAAVSTGSAKATNAPRSITAVTSLIESIAPCNRPSPDRPIDMGVGNIPRPFGVLDGTGGAHGPHSAVGTRPGVGAGGVGGCGTRRCRRLALEKSYRKDVETLARSKPEERARAADALGGWDDPAVALTRALDDPDAEVRENAARSLWREHKVAGSARDALRARLDDVPTMADRRGRAGGDGRRPVRAGAGSQARTRQHESLGPLRRGRRPDRPRAAASPCRPSSTTTSATVTRSSWTRGRQRRDKAQAALTALAKTQDRALIPPLVDALRPGTPGRKGMLRVLAVFEPPPPAGATS